MTASTVAIPLLSSVFVVAAATKLKTQIAFRSVLRGLLPGPVVVPLGYVVPAVELSVAVALLVGPSRRYGAIGSVVLLVAFCGALARMWQLGITQDCACFGEASTDATPRSGLIRNAFLLAAAAGVLASSPATAPWEVGAGDAAAAGVIALGLTCMWNLVHLVVSDRAVLFGRVFTERVPPATSEEEGAL